MAKKKKQAPVDMLAVFTEAGMDFAGPSERIAVLCKIFPQGIPEATLERELDAMFPPGVVRGALRGLTRAWEAQCR